VGAGGVGGVEYLAVRKGIGDTWFLHRGERALSLCASERGKFIYFKVLTFLCGDTPAMIGWLEGVSPLFLASVQFFCLASPRECKPLCASCAASCEPSSSYQIQQHWC